MKGRELIAYDGAAFQIEWYFTKSGEMPALDYYSELDKSQRMGLLKLLKRMGDDGKISDTTKFNNEGDKIFAFKPQPQRFLCFFVKGKKIIITNAFCKKQQKLPKNEKDRALACKKDYEIRVNGGEYYD